MKAASTESTKAAAARKRRVHRRVSSLSDYDNDSVGQQHQHDAKRIKKSKKLCSPSSSGTTAAPTTTTIIDAPRHASDDDALPSAAVAVSCIQLPRTVSAVAPIAEHHHHHPQYYQEAENKLENKITNITKISTDDVVSALSLISSQTSTSTTTLSSLDSSEGSSRSCSPAPPASPLSCYQQMLNDEPTAASKQKQIVDICTPRNKPKNRIKNRFIAFGALVLSGLALAYSAATRTASPVEPGSVFVPGAGFSGFWYTLGRLRSIPDPSAHNFYCYSAGCLGVVAALNGLDMEEVYDAALSMQTQWNEGEISRYDVVGGFVDYLLERAAANNETSMDLSLLNVLTTAKNSWFGVRLSVQTPSSMENLRTLLLQTTWIPYAVGDGLWLHGHMDGGVAAVFHPKCEVHLDLPLDLDLLGNIVNVNLGREKVFQFWEKGLAYGL